MNFKLDWKLKLGIILAIASFLIYLFAFISFGEPEKVLFYVVIDLAFVPLDILIVVLIIETVISKKEKETILEKLNMIIGVFFSEIANDFLDVVTPSLKNDEELKNILKNIKDWDNKDFSKYLAKIDSMRSSFKLITPNSSENIEKNNETITSSNLENKELKEFLDNRHNLFDEIRDLLAPKRDFLVRLLENPILLENEAFSNVLLATFHLDEELERRKSLEEIPYFDVQHLNLDIERVYQNMVYEWVEYLLYLKINYPYMFSIAIRINPFDDNADIQVTS
ncbi:MAG: hypothetical protein ACRCVG_04635 [Methanobacteriaceae archaeon]